MPLKEESNPQKNNKRSKKLIHMGCGTSHTKPLFKKNCICNHQKSALEQINKKYGLGTAKEGTSVERSYELLESSFSLIIYHQSAHLQSPWCFKSGASNTSMPLYFMRAYSMQFKQTFPPRLSHNNILVTHTDKLVPLDCSVQTNSLQLNSQLETRFANRHTWLKKEQHKVRLLDKWRKQY